MYQLLLNCCGGSAQGQGVVRQAPCCRDCPAVGSPAGEGDQSWPGRLPQAGLKPLTAGCTAWETWLLTEGEWGPLPPTYHVQVAGRFSTQEFSVLAE